MDGMLIPARPLEPIAGSGTVDSATHESHLIRRDSADSTDMAILIDWAKRTRDLIKYRGRGFVPVMYLDRNRQAKMIEAIVDDYLGSQVRDMRILDIGCGNGGIATHFAAKRNRVSGVDVEDKRANGTRDFDFYLVDSERLPFETDTFDLVLSHHVIEHVPNQQLHLEEIRRVLRPDGLCYLATPNKSSPLMEGHVGNNLVLHHREMEPLFRQVGFSVREYSYDVVTNPDKFHSSKRYGRLLPRRLALAARAWYPSHMFMLKPG